MSSASERRLMLLLAHFFPSAIPKDSVGAAIAVIALVIAVGLAVGSIKLRGIGLSVAGVLFAGLLASALGVAVDHEVLHFLRELGLILFVYSIGLQVGPGFVASLRRSGLKLNALAAFVVFTGTALIYLLARILHIPTGAAAGLLSGATTNTPSLAAAQQVLAGAENGVSLSARAGSAYAVAYPFGICGSILTLIAAKFLAARFKAAPEATVAPAPVISANLEVTNPALDGIAIDSIPFLRESGVVLSRIRKGGHTFVPTGDVTLQLGDTVMAVGSRTAIENATVLIGERASIDLHQLPSEVVARRVVVTNKNILGKTLPQLALPSTYGVTITRVSRAEVEFTPRPDFTFNFADTVLAVGPADGLKAVTSLLGDFPAKLNHPFLIPYFLGIALGILAGSIPIFLPGMPSAAKLGLAGGPLLAAILFSHINRIGPLIWYIPISANFMLRECGIVLFLACVGLLSGDAFVAAIKSGEALSWLALGAAITLTPLILLVLASLAFFKLPFDTIAGVVAGSMTDPPALAFAQNVSRSDAPAIAYATVYPLTMILRIISAQVLVMLLL